MTFNHSDYDSNDDEQERPTLSFILPQFAISSFGVRGFSCAKEWTEDRVAFSCGCPNCLHENGLTLVYHPEDWNESGDCQQEWRKRIVSVKTASYTMHLICGGYE